MLIIYTKEYRYCTGEIINDTTSEVLKIIEYTRIKNKKGGSVKGYKYKCLLCGNEDKISEYHLKDKRGCNVCSGKKVLRGVNDIHTKEPSFGRWFWRYEDGYKYTYRSNKKTSFKCQNCGEKLKDKIIGNMFRYFNQNKKLPCPSCSDGVSYPNRVMYNILKQVKNHSRNISFRTEHSPQWAVIKNHKNSKMNGRKKYDFYVKAITQSEGSKKIITIIIEMQGGQHFKSTRKMYGKKSEEEQENDKLKKLLSIEYSQCEYITVDARLSDLEYIKENILKSKLSRIIDLGTVNWGKVSEDSQKSIVAEVWSYWNSGINSVSEIAKITNIHRATVTQYLKRGAKLNRCNYDGKEEMRKRGLKAIKEKMKPVVRLSLDNKYIDEYKSMSEAGRRLNIANSNISLACSGRYKTAGGFKWMLKQDWKQLKSKK